MNERRKEERMERYEGGKKSVVSARKTIGRRQ